MFFAPDHPPLSSAVRRALRLLTVLLAGAFSGCESHRNPVAVSFSVDRRVAVAPAAASTKRPAIAPLGDEFRPLPFSRDPTVVAIDRVTTHAGSIRTAAVLAPVELTTGRLDLYWSLPGSNEFWGFKEPWRLYLHPRRPTRGKIAFRSPVGNRETPLTLRLERMPPPPVRLESTPFDIPPEATLDLAYGFAPLKVPRDGAITFTATLDCDWAWPQVLVHARLGEDDFGRWHDASIRHGGARNCRLTLESRADGGRSGEALWSVPRLVGPTTNGDLNVVLISLDTLRADHLSGYSYTRPTSPAIDDRLMKHGTTFTDASTTFPMTTVAHLGMFTSRYPAALPANGALGATVRIPMLTEILRDAGFSTVGITEDGLVSHAYGFGWGFDRLVEHPHAPIEGAQRVFEEGRRMLETHRDRRFFLFLHTYKIHDPYKPAEAFRDVFAPSPGDDALHRNVPEKHRAAFDDYDRCIREADTYVGEFLATLETLGLADRTLVVLASDHGESFGEHTFIGHGFTFLQEAIHVPLVFRGPGIRPGNRVTTPVSLVDVMPTILDLLGFPSPDEVQGRSLRDALVGGTLPMRPVFFEWLGAQHVGVRIDATKVVRARSVVSTYRITADGDESIPNSDASSTAATEIQRYVDDGVRRRLAFDAAPAWTLSPELHDQLRSLGYVE